jgi:hypothetical protein
MKAASIAVSRFAVVCAIAGIAASPHTVFSKTVTADTVVSSLLCADNISYPLRQDSLVTRTWRQQIGPITITNTPFPVMAVMMPSPPGSYDNTFDVGLGVVYRAVFDTLSPPLAVTVRNPTAITISGLAITIFDTVRSIAVLGPNDSVTFLFPVVGWNAVLGRKVGKEIADSAIDEVRLQVDSASAADQITVDFNINGLIADELSILNRYVSFSKSFVKAFDLGDSLDIHYLDILYGYLLYALTNNTDLPLDVHVSQLHLWDASWCAYHMPPLESVGDLAAGTTHSDSFGMTSRYMGRNTAVFQVAPHTANIDSFLTNLSACRLFPVWMYDSADMRYKSAAPVEFLISPGSESTSRTVDYKSTDFLEFFLAAPDFHYRRMLATVMQEYVMEGDTAKIEVPYPWNASSQDSLGKNTWADIFLIARLPDSTVGQPYRATIDTLGLTYTFFDPANTTTSIQCSAEFLNVRNNMLCRQQTNITSLMSLWPDSIYIAVQMNIPAGSRVFMVNEQSPLEIDFFNFMGRMNINGDYTVNIFEMTGVVPRETDRMLSRFDARYVNNNLVISIPEIFAGPTEVSLFSLSGRCIKKVSLSGTGKITVPIGRETARGAYSVTLNNSAGICTRKIVVR